jgi:hypothetical protein
VRLFQRYGKPWGAAAIGFALTRSIRNTSAMQRVLDYLKSNQKRFVDELCEYVRFASVSAQPQHRKDMAACSE